MAGKRVKPAGKLKRAIKRMVGAPGRVGKKAGKAAGDALISGKFAKKRVKPKRVKAK